MTALTYNLNIQQGETYKKVFRWLDAVGQLKPLAGWTGRGQIKAAYNTPSVLNLSSQTGEIILINGYLTILLSKEQTRSLPVVYKSNGSTSTTYHYDLFVFNTFNESTKLLTGNVNVAGALTDAL